MSCLLPELELIYTRIEMDVARIGVNIHHLEILEWTTQESKGWSLNIMWRFLRQNERFHSVLIIYRAF